MSEKFCPKTAWEHGLGVGWEMCLNGATVNVNPTMSAASIWKKNLMESLNFKKVDQVEISL